MMKCHNCNEIIESANAEKIPINTGKKQELKGIAYTCPHCHSVISIQVDPMNLDNKLYHAMRRIQTK